MHYMTAVEPAKQQGAAEALAAAAPEANGPSRDVTTELQKPAHLHKSGLLTVEEFSAARKKLLG
jgi:hypothetical protein